MAVPLAWPTAGTFPFSGNRPRQCDNEGMEARRGAPGDPSDSPSLPLRAGVQREPHLVLLPVVDLIALESRQAQSIGERPRVLLGAATHPHSRRPRARHTGAGPPGDRPAIQARPRVQGKETWRGGSGSGVPDTGGEAKASGGQEMRGSLRAAQAGDPDVTLPPQAEAHPA